MPPLLDSTTEDATPSTPISDPIPLPLRPQDSDLLRRSDSPVANSPSKSPNGQGSATVSSPLTSPAPVAQPSPSPQRRGAVDQGSADQQQQQAQQQQNSGAGVTKDGQQAPTDSITLGQLKGITAGFPRPKQTVYTFPSPPPDTSDLLSELEEFYSYVEVPQVLDHKDSFIDSWPHQTEFINTAKDLQLEYIQQLLEGLKSLDAEIRFTNARHLLYIAQGSFSSSTSPEHHLHLILLNCTLLRSSSALQALWTAVKSTGVRWEAVSGIPDPDAPYHGMGGGGARDADGYTQQERQEQLDEINGELALLLAVLYFMVECFRGEEQWGEELMALEPPMPIYLFNLVAGLRERNAKGYPVKKLLLLLWKSILCCIGGMKDIGRVKTFVRSVEGLPPDDKTPRSDNLPNTKVAPPDFQSFRNEITSKYPSYAPPPIPLVTNLDRLSAAAAPSPVRPIFSYHINANHDPTSSANGGSNSLPPAGPPQPATPAPSPPPSPAPKPKKQQFQTDQTKPFVLPFAPANAGPRGGPPRAVPASIDEAGELYRRNMRISTELWQTWKLREEFMADEGGLVKAEKMAAGQQQGQARMGSGSEGKGKARSGGSTASAGLPVGGLRGIGSREDAARLSRRMEALAVDDDDEAEGDGGEEGEDDDEEDEEDPMDPLTMLRRLERRMRVEEEGEKDEKRKKEARAKRVDVQRLERVEMLYRAVLPQMQSAVIVLLKLLLATVTANSNANNNGAGQGNDSGNDEPIELSLEDTDINRHREITSKAVSAILILTLKWFKTSHVMKFHYLSQLLVDSNCLLLILKMFGLQEVSTSVKTKNDRPDQNFFKYCHDSINPSSSSPRPEDAMLSSPPPGDRSSSPNAPKDGSTPAPGVGSGVEDDEVELITDYSWRNFFAVINFVHILQKLTKRKTHRVLLLVQYKSSAILKRILKVSHPTLQLYVLKVIKSQVPYCGRKWRQSNMKVITAIYLHCRPDLRDEWLTGVDVDADVEESLPHEQALRTLVRFFNTKHYGSYAPHLHRRSSSAAGHPPPDFGGAGMPPPSPGRPNSASGGDDAFPPTRSVTSYDSDGGSSPTSFYRAGGGHEMDDFGEGEYEVDDLLLYPRAEGEGGDWAGLGLGGDDWESSREDWERLGEMVGDYSDISDSESVGSLSGLLGRYSAYGLGGEASSDGSVSEFDIEEDEERRRNEWEHISPETITALEEERAAGLPHSTSPRPSRRRSSTGPISPALRPVLIDRDDDAAEAVEESQDGPVAAAPHSGPAVDEVELVFGE
ncbi:hypothetical protein BCR35DRAFT_302898 [Leucosporidium creatinivorum]|uniref:Uncharacterized protein n=1 Tax=Leucosporidium creatinivorum TaxID=106004 RepID=A0A1Y2FNA7_9BASI|nr:hypothetical protein BCR35DRAFT_302898 [Leucosporidium creatinivorum]